MTNGKGWVELPDCGSAGADSSKPLAEDLANASWATCKPSAKKAALAQKNNNKNWVELPNCSDAGADQTVPLKANLDNASIATCKKKKNSYIKALED